LALSAKRCVPCRGGVPALTGDAIVTLLRQLVGWDAVEEHHIGKGYEFPDFVSALAFVNRVGDLAEEQGHHPDIQLAWGEVGVCIWMHKIDELPRG